MKRPLIPTLLALVLGTGPALADDDCYIPMSRWQPRDAVQAMAAQQGWTVLRLKAHDGCYIIHGQDASGRVFDVRLNPATLAILDLNWRDGDEKPSH
ncbi:MAG: PepSY domain-containing protein [Limimaricola sp.]|uniref:PepSY domain-containing protein n=1 Tax=Limimaricola sp. TaxID=2211665 RepID=UPI001D219F2D|nr:PepSY domain-containing protein [Limimaricola sp.]MBI1418274.1 PepSY domain-containing protein [Limimaricola sp.]